MNKRNYDLVALDLDDTTLRSDGTLAPETREALVRAINAGVEIVIASGRAYNALHKDVLAIDGIKYAITSNGAAINELPSGDRIKSYALPAEDVETVLDIVTPSFGQIAVEGFIDGVPYSGEDHVRYPMKYGSSPAYVSYIQNTRTPKEDILGFIAENKTRMDSINVACPDPELREELRTQFAQRLKNVLCTSSVKHLTEMINKEAGKDSGMKYLCEMLGIPRERTVAAGNADNDISMIVYSGLGVAVANSSKNCLGSADLVIGNNNDNSIAKLLDDIVEGRI